MTVPPPTVVDSKPNWIQDAEAIAKADINRLEGTLGRVLASIKGVGWTALLALVVAFWALIRTYR